MLRFYGMEQSFTSLESTKSIAEDVGRASWFKACDISALLVIWYPEGHEVLLTRIFHRFAVVERRFAKSFFLFSFPWTHLSLLALVCCFLPRWSIDRSTNGECISSMMIQLTLSTLLLRASSPRKTPPYSSKWGLLAVVQPYATHAPMYSTILIQDLGTFIPRLLVDLYLCSLRPSLPLQDFILVPSFMRLTPKEPSGWRARFPKSCWPWENFCCCGSMLIAWNREMFPDRFLGILDWSRDGWGGIGELREDRSTFDGRALFRELYVEDRLWVYNNLMGREHCSEAYNRRSFSDRLILLYQ